MQTTVIINPVANAYISLADPNTNFALSSILYTGKSVLSNSVYRSLLKFDLSGVVPSNNTITNASLNLFIFRKDLPDAVLSPQSINVFTNNSDFSENTVTWNSAPVTSSTIYSKTITNSDVNRYISIDITNLVIKWSNTLTPNFGITLAGIENTISTLIGYLSDKWSIMTQMPFLSVTFSSDVISSQSFVQLYDRNYTNELTANAPLNLSNEGINPIYSSGSYTIATTTTTNDTLNLPGPGLYNITVSLRASFLLPLTPPAFGSTYQILFNILNESNFNISSLNYYGTIPNDPNAILDTQLSIQFLFNTTSTSPSLKIALNNFDFSLSFKNKLNVFNVILIVQKWKNS